MMFLHGLIHPYQCCGHPLQMGLVWMEAKYVSGMPIADRIPPASSYPACIAVKCAQLQSAEAGEQYPRRIREALMLNGRNIARHKVLVEEAEKLG